MEEDSLPHALLAIGIIGIVIFSICIAWIIVLCERCRRRRKFRPGKRNGTIAQSEEDWRPLPPANLVIVNKGFLSKSTPDILMEEAVAGRLSRSASFTGSEPPFVFHTSASAVELTVHDQIAAILGTFPHVAYREESQEDPILYTSAAVVHTNPKRIPSSDEEDPNDDDEDESHTEGLVLLETTI